MINKVLATIFCLLFVLTYALADEKDALRNEYSAIAQAASDCEMFDCEPDINGFRSVGSLRSEKAENALAYVNFIRKIAGLNAVTIDPLYSMRAQHAACLLAANDELSHTPARCEGMDDAQYATAYAGAGASNIAKLAWEHAEILLEAVSYFERDDGDINMSSLPHRRWLLDPNMKSTGFGLAVSESGNSYIAMYASDSSGTDDIPDYVAWPADGIFPAEMMRSGLAWSISLNDSVYDIKNSDPVVTMTEAAGGEVFRFDIAKGKGDGYGCLNDESYGSGPCIIFIPDLSNRKLTGYEQNQQWEVRVTGLVLTDGTETEISYTVRMVSLLYQRAVGIEIMPQKADLLPGESIRLTAAIVPQYADPTSVRWTSSDEGTAQVDENGLVTAVNAGSCEIIAETGDGCIERCVIEVR